MNTKLKPYISRLQKTAQFMLSFAVPQKNNEEHIVYTHALSGKDIVALIPTHKPQAITYKLVQSLLSDKTQPTVIVVDDSTPEGTGDTLAKLHALAKKSTRLHVIRTPKNLLKTKALNYGSKYIKKIGLTPEVLITFDDDVILPKSTLTGMIQTLYSSEELGAVCSSVRIKNKNKNLFTRLQGLEYHNFNISKTGDNGFLYGPLVMQGMLVAFKYSVFKKLGGFNGDSLIEDYEITARLKQAGYKVRIAQHVWAWTNAPDTLSEHWRQRVRWTYGGLTVLRDNWKFFPSVAQDFIGHTLFIALFTTITLSFVLPSPEQTPNIVVGLLIIGAFFHFSVSYLFNVFNLKYYKDADWTDRFIRLAIIPEYAYSMLLTVTLLGSYLFFVFNMSVGKVRRMEKIYKKGLKLFDKVGYTLAWGTRGAGKAVNVYG